MRRLFILLSSTALGATPAPAPAQAADIVTVGSIPLTLALHPSGAAYWIACQDLYEGRFA